MATPLNISTPAEIDTYRSHVIRYTDIEVPEKFLAMTQAQQYKVFKMLSEYAPIIEKMFPPGVDILEHIQGKRWEAAKANPHAGIDYNYDDPLTHMYDAWVAAGKPA